MNPKPATLIILTPGFPSDERDTSCLPAQQVFVRALNRIFPELRVVLVSFEYPHRKETYQWFGNTVMALGGWKEGKVSKLMTLMAVWRRLMGLQRGNAVVGLLSFWCGPCALAGTYFGSWRGLPHFTWILGQDARAGNQFIRLIRPKASALVAMSGFLAEEFNRNYRIRPGHIIPNGIDPTLFGPGGVVRDIDVLGVGNLTKLKRYDLFVSVVDGLRSLLPGVRGVICGKGEEEGRLKEMIRGAGLCENLQLAGELPHREVLSMMQRSKILLHTSSYEGLSTVCIEALYAGAHVISFIDKADEAVKNWHVVGSEEEMVAKALELLQSKDIVYGAELPFTMDDSVRKMMGLYGYKEAAMS
jgi:glycosyltransferase involved in cell wall biosynthesis